MNIKELLLNWRVILLFVFIILSLLVIQPSLSSGGVVIRSIDQNSTAAGAGFTLPKSADSPRSLEKIVAINNQEVNSELDYYKITDALSIGDSVQIKTNKGLYRLTVLAQKEITILNETQVITLNETVKVNTTINGTTQLVDQVQEVKKTVPKTEERIIGPASLGLRIQDAPFSNIRKGLDLQGGIRVLLQPEHIVSQEDMDIILTNLHERLNVYGLSDVIVREASDLSGNQYILIEMAGAQETEIKELIAKQGVFEAKVGNDTAFKGGQDITYVCRSAQCSGIDPSRGCGKAQEGFACGFRFAISLSPEAAQRQAGLTSRLDVISDPQSSGGYLSEKLRLVLDGQEVDALNIGADLKGSATTDIAISGSGAGATQQAAVVNALENMKRLQTILITGSLPVKLNVVKTDTISPVLGKEFVKSALTMGLVAILAVALVIFIVFRRWQVSLPMFICMLAEVIILLGVAAFIKWNLDIAAIAGILVAVGTGVDDQIIIADETIRGESKGESFKERLKKAFFIIFGSYFSTMFAMVPLLFAGAGLIKGFALTTMIGVTIGVFITRPAYAAIVEKLL